MSLGHKGKYVSSGKAHTLSKPTDRIGGEDSPGSFCYMQNMEYLQKNPFMNKHEQDKLNGILIFVRLVVCPESGVCFEQEASWLRKDMYLFVSSFQVNLLKNRPAILWLRFNANCNWYTAVASHTAISKVQAW